MNTAASFFVSYFLMRKLLFFILLALSIPALSQQHQCGDAEVNIVKTGEWESTRYQVLVQLKERKTELWLNSVDFVASQCVLDSNNRNKVLIQAYCSGSGCSEHTYIVVNARTLMVELVPVMQRPNLLQVEEILGRPIEK